MGSESITQVSGFGGITDEIRDLVAASEQFVVLGFPYAAVEHVETALRNAVERGTVVLVLLYGASERDVDPGRVEGVGTVVRTTANPIPLLASVDFEQGVLAQQGIHSRERRDEATVFEEWLVSHTIFGEFMGNYWSRGVEQYTADPTPLPLTSEWMPRTVIESTLRHRAGQLVTAEVEASPVDVDGDRETFVGDVVDTRQSFVTPGVSRTDNQSALVVETPDGTVTVGGVDAYLEDYEATAVTLRS